MTTESRPDIANREDIRRLVVAFYDRAFQNPHLGHIFIDIAHTDIEAHIPHMCDFWEQVLFRTVQYRRNIFEAHYDVHIQEPWGRMHFMIWEDLWHETVDEMFAGPKANQAKVHASRMSTAIQRRFLQGSARDMPIVPTVPKQN